ncbi:rifin [Plasmodium reichenowi]|uniref:Rifin n=1 Tax=Plasmodium reichenowi TaxID=5854 RepID=A0A060RW11_PLARE|nr:rifin [Plasmodium reichenowi]
MKLHYTKILLFFFPLNILLTSYHAHNNKNKLYIASHHSQTNRSLCECDTQSSIYDKDADVKSVKQQFDDRTSQRFEEYEERMKNKRQKRKEERDKNIQEIIDKDKMDKSLAEKIEKGCLRCGCVLGGVAASVGVFGGLGIYGSKTAAITAATDAALAEATDSATKAGMNAVVSIIERLTGFYKQQEITGFISVVGKSNFDSASALRKSVVNLFSETCKNNPGDPGNFCHTMVLHSEDVTFNGYAEPGRAAFQKILATKTPALTEAKVSAVESTYGTFQTAIIASVIAILIIALVMIIIYLVLRYRRKKKMNKKVQYTKLLNQ